VLAADALARALDRGEHQLELIRPARGCTTGGRFSAGQSGSGTITFDGDLLRILLPGPKDEGAALGGRLPDVERTLRARVVFRDRAASSFSRASSTACCPTVTSLNPAPVKVTTERNWGLPLIPSSTIIFLPPVATLNKVATVNLPRGPPGAPHAVFAREGAGTWSPSRCRGTAEASWPRAEARPRAAGLRMHHWAEAPPAAPGRRRPRMHHCA
jgi:hypothetical protein